MLPRVALLRDPHRHPLRIATGRTNLPLSLVDTFGQFRLRDNVTLIAVSSC